MIRGPRWEYYHYVVEGGFRRCVVTFDVEIAQERTHAAGHEGRRVVIGVADGRVLSSGLPNDEEVAALSRVEESIISALEWAAVPCRLIATHTHPRRHELIFQVSDEGAFERAILGVAFMTRPRPIDIEKYPAWTYYDEVIRPRREHAIQIVDRRIIGELIERGCRPGAPIVVDHNFTGPAEALALLRSSLLSEGYSCTEEGDGYVFMSRSANLDIDEIWSLTRRFDRKAADAGARYEGWGASPPESAE